MAMQSPTTDFGWALMMARGGSLVHRRAWKKKDDVLSHDGELILAGKAHGKLKEWGPTQEDLLAVDWQEYRPEKNPE